MPPPGVLLPLPLPPWRWPACCERRPPPASPPGFRVRFPRVPTLARATAYVACAWLHACRLAQPPPSSHIPPQLAPYALACPPPRPRSSVHVRVGAWRAAWSGCGRRLPLRQPGLPGFHCGRISAQLDHVGPGQHRLHRRYDRRGVYFEADAEYSYRCGGGEQKAKGW